MFAGPSVALPGRIAVEDAADASRDAVRAFLGMGSDKASVSAWLVGPYREATRFAPRRIRRAHARGQQHGKPGVDPEDLDEVVRASKVVVRGALAAAYRGIDDLVECLPSVIRVAPARDVYGQRGFVPVDEPRMQLVDRLLALVVADYLTRPSDFEPSGPPTSGTHPTQRLMKPELRRGATG